jgi:hypothetical protein
LSASILEQLTTPLHDFVATRPQMLETSELVANKVPESNHLSTGADQGQETKVCFCCCARPCWDHQFVPSILWLEIVNTFDTVFTFF